MARLVINLCITADDNLAKTLDGIRRAQRDTNRLIREMGASLMASVDEFSTEITELAGLLDEQSTDIDTLATFISEHGAEIPDALLSELSAAVDKVSGNSSRLVQLAQAAPEVPTDPGTPTEV